MDRFERIKLAEAKTEDCAVEFSLKPEQLYICILQSYLPLWVGIDCDVICLQVQDNFFGQLKYDDGTIDIRADNSVISKDRIQMMNLEYMFNEFETIC